MVEQVVLEISIQIAKLFESYIFTTVGNNKKSLFAKKLEKIKQ